MKKKLNFLLILAVLGLWGTAGYRFIKNNLPADRNVSEQDINAKPLSLLVKRDTFELRLPERDPFMGKLIGQRKPQVPSTPSVRRTVTTKKTPTDLPDQSIAWPEITYFGNIKAATTEMAVVKIAGKMYRLHCGEQASGILLKNITTDKIEVVYNKEARDFRLERNYPKTP